MSTRTHNSKASKLERDYLRAKRAATALEAKLRAEKAKMASTHDPECARLNREIDLLKLRLKNIRINIKRKSYSIRLKQEMIAEISGKVRKFEQEEQIALQHMERLTEQLSAARARLAAEVSV